MQQQLFVLYSPLLGYVKKWMKLQLDASGECWVFVDTVGDNYSLAVGMWEGYLTSRWCGFLVGYLGMTIFISEFCCED